MGIEAGTVLWEPPPDVLTTSRMGRFATAASTATGRDLEHYDALWRWSVEDLEGFWGLVSDELDVRWHDRPQRMLADESMPGAVWAPGGTLNYAEHALRGTGTAIVHRSQSRAGGELSYDELRDRVARCRAGLQRLGVDRGDRVVAYLPNVPETIVAFLATASLGAVWTSCAPEFGVDAVVDRVAQIEPTVLLVVDGYRYGDKRVDRSEQVAAIRAALPGLQATVVLPYLGGDGSAAPAPSVPEAVSDAVPDVASGGVEGVVTWDELLASPGDLRFESVPFDHPLYVLYSSGTTGKPKAIVHGHGGILLEHVKVLGLHHDLGPGERFCWFTTTGWMMWNYLVSGLCVGATIVLFDGDPGHPDLTTLWRLAAEERVTLLGVSAPFVLACRSAGLSPGTDLDLTALRAIGSTGAPLPPEGFAWLHDQLGADVHIGSASGGTDVCTAFVAGAPMLPVRAGEIPGRCLGAAVEAWTVDGTPVVGRRGELVITRPMPSMPIGFWADDGSRYRAAYFEQYPGVWRHGDWLTITEDGACVITGRSDATLNRGGVRMGSSEFYSVVHQLDEVLDSLVVHVEDDEGGPGRLVLFVVLADGVTLDDDLRWSLATTIRGGLSPRHVPDEIHQVSDVPRTLSGKKLEVPVKRLLLGEDLDEVLSQGALQNPEVLDEFVAVL